MAVRDEHYTSYEGALETGRAWWPIAEQTVRTAVGFTRTKVVVLLLWILPIVAGVGVVAEYALLEQSSSAPSGAVVSGLLQLQFYSLAGLLAASGCNAVSDDMQYEALRLYVSKPIDTWEYAVGKFLGLAAVGSLVTVVPALAVGGLRVALMGAGEHGAVAAAQVGWALALSAAMTFVLAAVMAGISSLSVETWRVFLTWSAVIVVPAVVGMIVDLTPGGGAWGSLISLQGNFDILSDLALSTSSVAVPGWAPFAVLGLAAAFGLFVLHWRIRRHSQVEVE